MGKWAGHEFLFYILFIEWVWFCLKQIQGLLQTFLRFNFIIFSCVSMCLCVFVQVFTEVEEGVESPGAEVTGGRELPNTGAGN